MAGERLEQWSTLTHGVLAERISQEAGRALTFEETQLFNAARERLLSWKAPSSRSKAMNQEEKKPEVQTDVKEIAKEIPVKKSEVETQTEVDQPAVKAKAATKKTVSPKAAKKAAPAAKSVTSTTKKEASVAKKTKAKSTAKSNGTGKRIPEDAVLKVSKSFKNPYKEGTGPFKRFEICAKSNGKTYAALKAMASLKSTTPLNFVKAGGGEFIHSGK
jgi:hypothetical protein